MQMLDLLKRAKTTPEFELCGAEKDEFVTLMRSVLASPTLTPQGDVVGGRVDVAPDEFLQPMTEAQAIRVQRDATGLTFTVVP